MKYYQITEEQMMSILLNLNELEREYCQGNWDSPRFQNMGSYLGYIRNQFIKANQLQDIYYPPVPEDMENTQVGGMLRIDEAYQILSNMNITICKQFNFHVGKLHTMNCYEAIWMLKGTAQFLLGTEKIELKEGDFFIHPPEIPYEFRMGEDGIGVNLVLRTRYIKEKYLSLFYGNSRVLQFFKRTMDGSAGTDFVLFHSGIAKAKVNALILNMFIEYLWGSKYQAEIFDRYFEMIVFHVRKTADLEVETLVPATATEAYYDKITAYIRDNYRTGSLQDASIRLNISQQYLSRILRKMGKPSFHQLLEEERIKKVKEYLLETSFDLETVAELTGFSGGSYLSRFFHRKEQMTASEFRLKNGK